MMHRAIFTRLAQYHQRGGSSSWNNNTRTLTGAAVLASTVGYGYHICRNDSTPDPANNTPRESLPLATSTAFMLQPPVSPSTRTTTTTTTTNVVQKHTTTANKKRRKPYSISAKAVKGARVTMEDEYCTGDGGRFAAVFDGHGGRGVSHYLKHHLYEAILRHRGTDNSIGSHLAALRAAFTEMEAHIREQDPFRYQGSTAVAIQVCDDAILSANIGDSRAVLSRNGVAVPLTRDHKPNDVLERARIQSLGETIEYDRFSKVFRIRNLSVSRAIGDRYAKPVVSGEVELQSFCRTPHDDFVILASDGLWDALTSEEAVELVHKRLRQVKVGTKEDRKGQRMMLRKKMAKILVREALHRGSSDNICVVVVWLRSEV